MLKAVCEALGWQYGAIWQVESRAGTPCDASGRGSTGAAVRRVHRRQRARSIRARASDCPDGSGQLASLPGSPTSPRDANFPRARAAERAGLHSAFALPIRPGPPRQRGDGVLQPRHLRADARAAGDDDDGVQPDRTVSSNGSGPGRISIDSSSSRWTCSASRRSTAISCASIQRGRRCSDSRKRKCVRHRSWTSSTPTIRRPPSTPMSTLTTGAKVIDFENRYRAKDGTYK